MAMVGKGIRKLVEGTGKIQDRLADALPEAGWLEGDASAMGSLSEDESRYFAAIRARPDAATVRSLSDQDAKALARNWWLLYDSLTTAS